MTQNLPPPKRHPITKIERQMLAHLRDGPGEAPRGVGPSTINKLLSRRMIIRAERLQDYGAERYALTKAGIDQL